MVGKTQVSSFVGFYYKKRDRKEKKVMVKLVDLNYLFISSSISVGKGKLIPNEKKRKSISQNDQTD